MDEIEFPQLHCGAYCNERTSFRGNLESGNVKQSYALGTYATVFQAEIFAILMVASNQVVKRLQSKVSTFALRQQSQAALKALFSPRMRSPLVQECTEALEELARYKEVELVWVPGHCTKKLMN
ncbi:hypothetical protein NQ317_018330 [Molorchus minor]|uniref:RNase H type-1 domain-containing protein n=1 Tax=Molorchus minor TaxID=1323400 RepID=A0ABQ9J491_9CUCU|nr:hypothetical protein NQ317_018330 [Molorchus minor]